MSLQFEVTVGEESYIVEDILSRVMIYPQASFNNHYYAVEGGVSWGGVGWSKPMLILMRTIDLYRQNNMGLTLEEYIRLTL